MLKIELVRKVVSIQYRLVAERQIDGWTHDDNKYRASIASRGKNQQCLVSLKTMHCTL